MVMVTEAGSRDELLYLAKIYKYLSYNIYLPVFLIFFLKSYILHHLSPPVNFN